MAVKVWQKVTGIEAFASERLVSIGHKKARKTGLFCELERQSIT